MLHERICCDSLYPLRNCWEVKAAVTGRNDANNVSTSEGLFNTENYTMTTKALKAPL
jgi:hypothetical protein